jgi:HTH-type transcriptional regulator/antitoxin HigA
MRTYRTLHDYTEQYFKTHPQEIDAFLKESFEEYARDGDSKTLLSQLRVMARVKGISSIAEQIGVTRQGLQKALSEKGNPRLSNITSILMAMGYHLMPQRMDVPAR